LQNHAAKFDFAILKAAWRKSPKGLFDKLCFRREIPPGDFYMQNT
jgi:hypothetical protein